MGRLSRNWIASNFFKAAYRDMGYDRNSPLFSERFDMINKSVETVYNLFYGLLGNSYLTKVAYNEVGVGNHSTSGTGTFTASTKTVTFSGMRTSFTSADVEKMAIMRVGNYVYVAHIESYTSATVLVLHGYNLPTSNQTIASFEVISSVPADGSLLLNSLNMNRSGSALKLVVESSLTKQVEAVSLEAYKNFRSAAKGNLEKIVYTFVGDEILMKKGDSLASFGSLTLYYPRVPYQCSLDAHKVDLPDGSPCQIALLRLSSVIAMRLGKPEIANRFIQELYTQVEALYKSFSVEVNFEEIKEKVSALV